MGGSAALLSADQINKVISDDTFKSYLSQLDMPKGVIIGLAVFGMITFLAHGHGDD